MLKTSKIQVSNIEIPEEYNIIDCEYATLPDKEEIEKAVLTNHCVIEYANYKQIK